MKKKSLYLILTAILLVSFSAVAYASDFISIPYDESGKSDNLTVVSTGSSVQYSAGTYFFTVTDLKVAARSIPMVWERTYRSNRVLLKDKLWVFGEPADGPLGYGWMTPWFIRIEGDAFVNGEGRYIYFDKDANGNYIPNMALGYVLKKTTTGYELLQTGGDTYTFNTSGKLTSIKDPRGNTATLTYDTSNRLTAIKDVMGRTIFTLTYNANNRISQLTDIAGRTVGYEYDSIGRLTGVRYDTLLVTEYTYNSNHGMTSKTNALGETYTIKYYPAWTDIGVTASIIDPVGTEMIKQGKQPTGHEMVFVYDFQNRIFYYTDYRGTKYKNILNEKGQILSVEEIQGSQTIPITKVEYPETRTTKTTDALGNITITQRDEWGNVIKEIDPEGNEWRFTYNTQSKLLSTTDPTGTITRYEYDSYGNRTKETLAVGTTDESITTYTYNQYNERTSEIKGNATTNYTYDSAGNIIIVKDPMQYSTTMTYNNAGNMLTITQPLIGSTIYSDYDFKGKPGKITNPNGNIILNTYDVLGRIKAISNQADNSTTEYFYVTSSGICPTCGNTGGTGGIDYIILPEGNKIDYDYGNAGDLIKITDNDGNSINYTYDSRGNKIKEEIKDAGGTIQKTQIFVYDLLNRLQKAINPDNSYFLYAYDSRGNKVSEKNPNGNVTSYTYDSLKRLIKTIQPGNIVTTFTYDKRGNLTSVKDANGNTTTYEYDTQDRVTKTISPDTGTTTYSYYLNGYPKTNTDAKGIIITYSYDSLNRLTKVDFPTDTDIVYTYDTCTNGKGRLCSMTDASGTTSYEYSVKGQITKETKVIDGVTYVTQYSYSKNGNIMSITYPSGKVITYNYSNDRVINVINNSASIASNIKYKPFGGMTSITNGNGLNESISYDNQYRISNIQASGILNLAFGFDANGNITGITNNLDTTKNKTYTYDALDRLTGATGPWGTLSYTYDGVGNRQKETNNANATNYTYTVNKLVSTAGEKAYTFGYDNNGNTVAESRQLNAERSYVYNQNQRLIKVTENGTTKGEYVYNGNGQRVKKTTSSGTVIFHYDLQGQIMAESTQAGSRTAEYVFLNNDPFVKFEGNNAYYYHNDHLGTPQKMTDASGTVVWYGEFLPFGEMLSITGTITNNLRFPGQYFDLETGLNYNYFRDYNSMIGRYIEADPIGFVGDDFNYFTYVGNNPENWIDPKGLSKGTTGYRVIPRQGNEPLPVFVPEDPANPYYRAPGAGDRPKHCGCDFMWEKYCIEWWCLPKSGLSFTEKCRSFLSSTKTKCYCMEYEYREVYVCDGKVKHRWNNPKSKCS